MRMLVLLLAIVVLAKPVYTFVTEQLVQQEPSPIVYEEQTAQPVTTTQNITVAKPAPGATIAKPAAVPNTVDSAETLADAFYAYFSQYATAFEIQYSGSTANIDAMIQAAIDDALARDSYVAGHMSMREVNYEYSKVAAKISVKQTYLTNLQQEAVVDAKVAEVVAPLNIAGMNDFEKVKFVNDYIVTSTQYSEETITSPHSAYTLVQEGKAVCQGYALFATKLLRALGVEAIYVTGEVYSGGHAWNLVKVDGQWYHLDTTWNDPVPDRGQGIRYHYFLKSDTALAVDHSWQRGDYPQATSEQYRYMHVVQDGYVHGEFMYYSHSTDNNKLYRLHMKTGESVQLANTRALFIVGDGQWLYFSNYSNGAYLTKIRLDGSEETVLLKEEVSDLQIRNGELLFYSGGVQKKIAL